MAEISNPSAPASPGSSSPEELAQHLDLLLERYLHLMDRYQTLQRDLIQQTSSGFLSLSQANFSSTSHIRYGQDFYDDRMQASRKVHIDAADQDGSPRFSVIHSPTPQVKPAINEDTANNAFPSPPSPNTAPKAEPSDHQASEHQEKGKANPRTQDPLRWFGILVPPALRSAQGHFSSAVDTSIPHLASTVYDIALTEQEIRHVRKQLKY
ncbi:MAG: hypothetical protein M1819_003688 [Sarea resinae]|nr:MAG: hypothetical protein M1819_003688 [Sarea resinae]